MNILAPAAKSLRTDSVRARRPRVGFLGLGWIGRDRMEALARSGLVEISALSDTAAGIATEAARGIPNAEVVESFNEMLNLPLDGIVIATPSALHAEQSLRALGAGMAVFCQKPLGRTARETTAVIQAAQRCNRHLGVDLSYRFLTCLRQVHELCRQGELGEIYAVDLMFHNAYGPDKAWFYDEGLSGGGCVMDLGIHLVDLALWNLGFPKVVSVTSHLFHKGKQKRTRSGNVEDYAVATIGLETGATVRLACSWKLPAGCDAAISGTFFGTRGGAGFHNHEGSFYDFVAERYRGTKREMLHCAREQWGGRAAVNWARGLAEGGMFDPEIWRLADVSRVLDAIYENA